MCGDRGGDGVGMSEALRLYSYWRSSAAYRVRIGLNLKGLAYEIAPVHLVRDGGQQHSAAYRELNPQGLVPLLCHGQRRLSQSLAVLEYLDEVWPQPERDEWVRHWIAGGFDAMEAMLADHPSTGVFCEGNVPSLADCCLVPQVYNARRFGIDMDAYPTIRRIEAACLELPAFDAARPERQPDAPAAG